MARAADGPVFERAAKDILAIRLYRAATGR